MNYKWLVLLIGFVTSICASQSQPGRAIDNQEPDLCVVCREALVASQECGPALELPCHHRFHQKCIAMVLYYDPRCPICRASLATDFGVMILQQEPMPDWLEARLRPGWGDRLVLYGACCCFFSLYAVGRLCEHVAHWFTWRR